MSSIFIITRWEYLTRIRSKWFIISTLIIPLIVVGSMFLPSLAMKGDSGVKLIALVEESGELTWNIEQFFDEHYHLKDGQPKYQLIPLGNSATNNALKMAASLLDSSVIDAYVYIPANVIETNEVTYYARYMGNYREQDEIRSAVNAVLLEKRIANSGLDPALVREVIKPVDFKTIEVSASGEKKQQDETLYYLIPIIFVLMLYFAIVMSSQVLLRSVLSERSNRLIEILLSSVSPTQLMSGKILGLGLLGLTQLTLYMVFGSFISANRGIAILSSNEIVFFYWYFVIGYLFFASIFAAIGSIFTSEQDAQQAVSIVSIVSVLPIMLSSYVIMNPESMITTILSFIPLITPFFMILLIGMTTPPAWQIIGTSLILMASAILAMLAAGKIFQTAVLMYGKRPTLPEIIQWLKPARQS
jgi:ABC-2 type transport system permease protein